MARLFYGTLLYFSLTAIVVDHFWIEFVIQIPLPGIPSGVRYREIGHFAAAGKLDTGTLARWRHLLALAVLCNQRCGMFDEVRVFLI